MRRFKTMMALAYGTVASMLLVALRPVYRLQIQPIQGDRIGHLALEPELFLCDLNQERRKRTTTCFYFDSPPVNNFIASKWRDLLPLGPKRWLRPLSICGTKFPLLSVKPHYWDEEHVDLHLLDTCPSHISLSDSEESRGFRLMTNLGLHPSQPYVCLAIRDSAYLADTYPSRDWSYHDYRDSDIRNYTLMMHELVNLGYAVIRMGRVVREPVQARHSMIIDYANSEHRSDFADYYLFANCAFCISTSTGMDALAHIARRPVGVVNLAGFDGLRIGHTTRLATFKSIMDADTGITLDLQSPRRLLAMDFKKSNEFRTAGLSLQENSPEHLRDFARRMHQIIEEESGKNETQAELDEKFLASIPWKESRGYDMTQATLQVFDWRDHV